MTRCKRFVFKALTVWSHRGPQRNAARTTRRRAYHAMSILVTDNTSHVLAIGASRGRRERWRHGETQSIARTRAAVCRRMNCSTEIDTRRKHVASSCFRRNAFSLRDDAVVHKLFLHPGSPKVITPSILKSGGAGGPRTVPPHQNSTNPQVVHKPFHVRDHG